MRPRDRESDERVVKIGDRVALRRKARANHNTMLQACATQPEFFLNRSKTKLEFGRRVKLRRELCVQRFHFISELLT